MSTLLTILKEAGCRITAPRKAMASALDEHSGQHLSAPEIRAILRRRGSHVSLASIYRNLKLLERLGAVHRGGPPHAHSHFELEHDAEVHLVCVRCGALFETTEHNPRLPLTWLRGVAVPEGFVINGFRVEARGLCKKCARSGGRRNA